MNINKNETNNSSFCGNTESICRKSSCLLKHKCYWHIGEKLSKLSDNSTNREIVIKDINIEALVKISDPIYDTLSDEEKLLSPAKLIIDDRVIEYIKNYQYTTSNFRNNTINLHKEIRNNRTLKDLVDFLCIDKISYSRGKRYKNVDKLSVLFSDSTRCNISIKIDLENDIEKGLATQTVYSNYGNIHFDESRTCRVKTNLAQYNIIKIDLYLYEELYRRGGSIAYPEAINSIMLNANLSESFLQAIYKEFYKTLAIEIAKLIVEKSKTRPFYSVELYIDLARVDNLFTVFIYKLFYNTKLAELFLDDEEVKKDIDRINNEYATLVEEGYFRGEELPNEE